MWEYLVAYSSDFSFEKDIEDSLDELGQEGWELVSVSGSIFYFKRKKSVENVRPHVKRNVSRWRSRDYRLGKVLKELED